MDFFGRQPFFARQQDDFFMPVSQSFTREPMFRRQKPILDIGDYYDPIFGNGGLRRREPCDCIDCQTERYYQQRGRKQQQRNNMQDDERVRGRKNKKPKKPKQKQEVQEQNTTQEAKEAEQQMSAPKVKHNVENKISDEKNEQMISEETSDTNMTAEQEFQRDTNENEDGPTNSEVETRNESKIEDNCNDEDDEEDDIKGEESEEVRKKKNNEAKIKLIEDIKNEVNELNKKVNELSTKTKNYDYLYCEEMLTKCLLELDNILAEGEEVVRTARKNVIKEITEGLKCLENKLSN